MFVACKSIRQEKEEEDTRARDTRKRKALILMEKTNKTFHFCQIV